MKKYIFYVMIAVLVISCNCISCKKSTTSGSEMTTEKPITGLDKSDGQTNLSGDEEFDDAPEMDTTEIFEIELKDNQGTGGL